jgi:NAD(P)-dependent dehydrogenase (short-subunit alcohol dehydrogenase family)
MSSVLFSSREDYLPVKLEQVIFCVKGVSSLTMCAALDLAPFNIRVNAVGSGLVGTPVGYREYVNRPYENPRIPIGHIGEPEDVGEAVAFLVSEKAKYIVGSILPVDGGLNVAL